jgi:hypothetical protein
MAQAVWEQVFPELLLNSDDTSIILDDDLNIKPMVCIDSEIKDILEARNLAPSIQ